MATYGRVDNLQNVQEISNNKGNLVLAKNDLLKGLPLTFLQQLTHKFMESVCAIHKGCQVVNGHSKPAGNMIMLHLVHSS